jgi:hypothetical protein
VDDQPVTEEPVEEPVEEDVEENIEEPPGEKETPDLTG